MFPRNQNKMAEMVTTTIHLNFDEDSIDGIANLVPFISLGKDHALYHYNEFEELYGSNVTSAWHIAEPLVNSDWSFRIPSFLS